jgi:hypothetical protein
MKCSTPQQVVFLALRVSCVKGTTAPSFIYGPQIWTMSKMKRKIIEYAKIRFLKSMGLHRNRLI